MLKEISHLPPSKEKPIKVGELVEIAEKSEDPVIQELLTAHRQEIANATIRMPNTMNNLYKLIVYMTEEIGIANL